MHSAARTLLIQGYGVNLVFYYLGYPLPPAATMRMLAGQGD
jgi:hypothetical protein